MAAWYRKRAQVVIPRRLAELARGTPLLRLNTVPPVTIWAMRTRWGSCSAAGRVAINVAAVQLPMGCLDYLLVHELCHLRVGNRGARFWRLLGACMPRWEGWATRLRDFSTCASATATSR